MGRPVLLDKKLVKKIAEKLKRPSLNVVKSISAMARRKGISSESALVLFARKYNIGSAYAQRKLSPDKQGEIRPVLLNTTTQATNHRNKIKSKSSNTNDDFYDPFLADSVYSNLSSVSVEAYQIIFVLENSLRSFIERALNKKFGSSWWSKLKEKKSTLAIAKKVADRKNNESGNWYHGKRGVHEIYYSDYTDLLQIIRSFDSEFNIYFKNGSEKNLPGKLAELAPTRNVVAHNNPITKDDLERLRVHAKDWLKYMSYLYKKL